MQRSIRRRWRTAGFRLAALAGAYFALTSRAEAEELGIGAAASGSSSGAEASVDAGADGEGSPARAPAETRGFEHGLRLGVSLPLGKTDGGSEVRSGDLNGVVGVRIPIWLDLGYRLDASYWVGLAAQLGLGTTGSDCTDAQECEWSDLRLAAQGTVALSPGSSTEPWLGLGLGWEWLRGSVTFTLPGEDFDLEQDIAVKARELLGGPQLFAQGGLRFDVGESLTLGPYAEASAGMFLTDEFDCPEQFPCPSDASVEDKQLHAWIGLGVRGTHGP